MLADGAGRDEDSGDVLGHGTRCTWSALEAPHYLTIPYHVLIADRRQCEGSPLLSHIFVINVDERQYQYFPVFVQTHLNTC